MYLFKNTPHNLGDAWLTSHVATILVCFLLIYLSLCCTTHSLGLGEKLKMWTLTMLGNAECVWNLPTPIRWSVPCPSTLGSVPRSTLAIDESWTEQGASLNQVLQRIQNRRQQCATSQITVENIKHTFYFFTRLPLSGSQAFFLNFFWCSPCHLLSVLWQTLL